MSKKKKRYKAASRKKKRLIKKRLLDCLGGAKCSKCGFESDCLGVFEFHHKNPKKKKFAIGSMTYVEKNWSVLLEEAKKCKILCCRCHRILHQTY